MNKTVLMAVAVFVGVATQNAAKCFQVNGQTTRSPSQEIGIVSPPPPTPHCTLTKEQSPRLRVFRLGMTDAQVGALDSSQEWQLKFQQNSGRSLVYENDLSGRLVRLFPFGYDTDKELKRRLDLEGVIDVELSFVNQMLTRVSITYEDAPFKDEALATELIKTLGLPQLAAWKLVLSSDEELHNSVVELKHLQHPYLPREFVYEPKHPQLRCKGFTITVVADQVTLNDIDAYEKARQQRQKELEQEEEKRRRAFKP